MTNASSTLLLRQLQAKKANSHHSELSDTESADSCETRVDQSPSDAVRSDTTSTNRTVDEEVSPDNQMKGCQRPKHRCFGDSHSRDSGRHALSRRASFRQRRVSNLLMHQLQTMGAAHLSDVELLALFLGGRQETALLVANSSLERFGSLSRLLGARKSQLCSIGGIGEARYSRLRVAQEIVRRSIYEVLTDGDVLSSPGKVREFLSLELSGLGHEEFAALLLDNRHRVIEYRVLFTGTIDGAAVYPREVLKHCLELNAAAVIFAHNHPSGLAEPSDADIEITKKLTSALALVDIRVLDHLIIGRGVQTSLAERGLI